MGSGGNGVSYSPIFGIAMGAAFTILDGVLFVASAAG